MDGNSNTTALAEVARRYTVAITEQMQELLNPHDLHDPIAAQFLPDARELAEPALERFERNTRRYAKRGVVLHGCRGM